ncbi:hypothetical protein [Pelagibaculum spongiae]|uniref:hypothetical protein n=1 Tax=Pelagibaculum spongiae TaxID=2080658 RepID=UPI0010577429|nr:hypothetical protein [Pelagibaculum spongiae]
MILKEGGCSSFRSEYKTLYSGAHRFLFSQLAKNISHVQLAFISNGYFHAEYIHKSIIKLFLLHKKEEQDLINSAYFFNHYDLNSSYKINPASKLYLAETIEVPIESLAAPQTATLKKEIKHFKIAYCKELCLLKIMQKINDKHEKEIFKKHQKNSNIYFIDDDKKNQGLLLKTCNIIDPTKPDYPLQLISLSNKITSNDQSQEAEAIATMTKRTRSQSI